MSASMSSVLADVEVEPLDVSLVARSNVLRYFASAFGFLNLPHGAVLGVQNEPQTEALDWRNSWLRVVALDKGDGTSECCNQFERASPLEWRWRVEVIRADSKLAERYSAGEYFPLRLCVSTTSGEFTVARQQSAVGMSMIWKALVQLLGSLHLLDPESPLTIEQVVAIMSNLAQPEAQPAAAQPAASDDIADSPSETTLVDLDAQLLALSECVIEQKSETAVRSAAAAVADSSSQLQLVLAAGAFIADQCDTELLRTLRLELADASRHVEVASLAIEPHADKELRTLLEAAVGQRLVQLAEERVAESQGSLADQLAQLERLQHAVGDVSDRLRHRLMIFLLERRVIDAARYEFAASNATDLWSLRVSWLKSYAGGTELARWCVDYLLPYLDKRLCLAFIEFTANCDNIEELRDVRHKLENAGTLYDLSVVSTNEYLEPYALALVDIAIRKLAPMEVVDSALSTAAAAGAAAAAAAAAAPPVPPPPMPTTRYSFPKPKITVKPKKVPVVERPVATIELQAPRQLPEAEVATIIAADQPRQRGASTQ